ncbi:MAG TPA: SusC/RagA family TonB-linked outer membrane protein [Bacteroidales bacterium]|nr:SusC/RagA family TonB-linked outer membrane protein [Bacteroidales bacterium]
MEEIRKAIIVALALFVFAGAYSQQRAVIRGRVIDKKEKIAVIGANVIEYDRYNRIINGTVCDVNGDFVLEVRDRSHIIKVVMIGYVTKNIFVDPVTTMTVELEPSNIQLEEVVVTARRKEELSLTNIDDRDVASSRVKVDMAEMKEIGVISASDALQGRVSGLDIIQASGDPGSGSQLVIRGLSSMGNNKPLVVIDGIPQFSIPTDFDLSSADQEDISNLINIALQDIKSIEVLKDAASTAIYGSRGADGVLIIETYKGRLGKVQFDYTYKNSLNFQPPAIPMLNGDEYIMLQLEEWHNSRGIFDIPPEIAYDKDYYDFYNYSANTDWIAAITQNSVTHDHYFNISGGGEKTRYFTSFSYVDEGGTTINTNAKRFSTRVNLDYFLSRKLLFSVLFSYTNNRTDGNLELDDGTGRNRRRNVREMAYIKAPNMSIREYDAYGVPTGEFFTPINSYQGSGSVYFNPVAVAKLGKNDREANSLQNTFTLSYNLTRWVKFRETVSFQFEGAKSQNYLPYNAIGSDWLAWTVNKAEESNNLFSSINTETQLAFDSPFDSSDHVISGAVTWITNQSGYEWMNIQSNKLPSTDIQDPAINGQINWMGDGSGTERGLGALINLNYKYKDRYMLQTILRADAHSSFGASHRWGLFKGISAGWRFSQEPFLQSLNFLGESMLRASWGVSGRQPTDVYARFATYGSTNTGNYMRFPSIVNTQVQLDNLQWETISSVDIGLELNLFNDRLYLEGDWYRKVTTDILFKDYDIPSSSGFERLKYLNGGELGNQGWELMADYKLIRKKDFRMSLNFNITHNVNSFDRLPDNFNDEQSTSISNGEYPLRVMQGQPIGSFFGFRYLGVYPTDADAIARDAEGNMLYDNTGAPIPMTYQGTYTFKGGDAKYADINHDGKIDLNDVVYIGDSNPEFIGGFGTSMKYKNIELTCGFHYRVGFDIINGVAIETEGMNNRNNQSKAVLSRWRIQGQDEEGMLPRAYLNHPANNLGSDRYVEPGDYLRLLNVILGYKLKPELCEKLKLRTLGVAVSARKLFTVTRYSGQDPEVGQDASNPFWIGVDEANTPPPRMITFTLSVGF